MNTDRESTGSKPSEAVPSQTLDRPIGSWGRAVDLLAAHVSPRGRITARTYVGGVLAPVVVLAALLTAWPVDPIWSKLLATALYWVFMAGLAKRLQDFGLPGLFLSSPVVLGLWIGFETGASYPAWLETYLYVAVGTLSSFAALTSGQPGPNRYGLPPEAEGGARRGVRALARGSVPQPTSVSGGSGA